MLWILSLLTFSAAGQIQKYPADITPVLAPPYSIFLNEYATPGSRNLSANIVFNDFNEPSWNFKLRIKIESTKVRLETTPGYRPQAPITLAPGVMRTFSGADWEDYLNYNNLIVSGLSVNDMVSSGGKLPEGMYSFCFQVLDYDTGDPLSQEICRTAWIKLMDPPRTNLPQCDRNLDPKLTQHPFTWQMFDALSPNGQAMSYQLTIWEITDPAAAVQTAVANGQALQIFQSGILNQSTYTYGLADPPLEAGKKYVYRVQAIDPDGKDRFKNQGNSEFCFFYYGWPINGKVNLKFPIEGGGFRKRDIPYVSWSPVSTQLPGQDVSYEIKIVPINDNQTKEQAIESNTPWFYYSTPDAQTTFDRSHQVDQQLSVMKKYAWQIKAITNNVEVGKSSVSYFNGPALMENFFAGIHRVAVDYLDGSDLNNISGEGRIRLKPEAEAWTSVRFEHIQLKNMGDFYVMVGGEFFYAPPKLSIELAGQLERNGKAYFDVDRFRINKEGIYVEGLVRWPLPIPAIANGVASVKSQKQFANYNNFTINSVFTLDDGNDFRLLEPFNFSLNLTKSSIVYVNDNNFRFDFNGTVELPSIVKSKLPGRVTLPFTDADQLFYIQQDSTGTNNSIAPLSRSGVEIVTTKYTLDLSEEESPEKFQGDLMWKGLYLNDFDFLLNTTLDASGQFDVTERVISKFVQPSTRELDAFVTSDGLAFKADISYPDSTLMKFQTFPSLLRQLHLETEGSQVIAEKSFVKGDFLIPVVSVENKFRFTIPVNNLGFQDGYLENVEGTKFTHNKGGGDQEMNIAIKRAVLSSYERIAMTLEIEWPSMGITLPDLRGFNVWGDYSIGFDRKNGTIPLTQRYNAKMSGYDVTMSVIGAGSNEGNYIFATTADAGLGDDVSGSEGAPMINVYSAVANPLAPLGGGTIGPSNVPTVSLEQATQNVRQRYTEAGTQLLTGLNQGDANLLSEAQSNKESVSNGFSQTTYEAEDMFQSDGEVTVADGVNAPADADVNPQQREIALQIATGFVTVLSKPVMAPIRAKTKQIEDAVDGQIKEVCDAVGGRVYGGVRVIVKPIADELVKLLENDKVDVETPIYQMADATVASITEEIVSSLRASADNNIKIPLHVLLEEQINGRIQKYFIDNASKIIYEGMKGGRGDVQTALNDVADGAPKMLEDIAKDVGAFVKPDHIRSTIEATASDFIKNISLEDVKHDLRRHAEEILLNALQREAAKYVGQVAAQYAQDVSMSLFGGEDSEVPINFVGVAQRFQEGGIKGVFNVDRVRVKLLTPVIDLNGFMSYTPKHPVYGDVWLGDIDMTIKVPKKFAFNAIYFNGKKDGISYWFCQITPPDGDNAPYSLGKPLPKSAKELNEPVDIGIAQIVGASGRLYHHMIETPGNGIVPDASMKYGAYMHFVFFDKRSEGQNLRLEVSGEINTKENGDYTIAFDGNLQLRSPTPKPLVIDDKAAIQGTVMIRYNSAEEHFLGYAAVIVKTSSLCAQASLLVDVKPGKWRVAIGSREERIIFVPGCAGWSPTGWLDVNETTAELGLGLQYSGRATSPKIDIGVVGFYVEFDAGVAAGILAAVQYNPTFKLLKAGIWVDIWANLDAHYKIGFGSWKSVRLVEIYIRGDLVVIFEPPPTMLEGSLRGHVKVIGFGFDFNSEMKKQL